ncbi:MAG TPA: acyltransferase, partial [Segetibacter sp.]
MKEYIPSLNGLRAISIFFVLFAHVLLKNFNFSENPGGQIGVNIFFVISGYLITLLLLREEENNGFISLKNFFIRRTIRIFPIYYILLLVYLILEIAGILRFSTNSWIASITYTKYFLHEKNGDWESGHLWSLSIEEHFYLIWPLVFKILKNYRIHFAFLVIIVVTTIRLTTDISVMHIVTRADALLWGCVFAIFNNQIVDFFKSRNRLVALVPFLTLLSVLAFKRVFTLMKVDHFENYVTAFLGSYGLVTNICIGC